MKNRVVWFTAIVIGFMGSNPSHAQNVVNLLGDGDFEQGPATQLNTWAPLTWNLYSEGQSLEVVSDDPYEGQYCLKVTVPTRTANFWDAGFKQPGHVFQKGRAYTFSAWMKSLSGPLDINMKLERDGGDYSGTEVMKTITEEWAEYSITTPVYTETVDPAAATFHIGHAVGEFLVDGIRMYEGEYVPPPPTSVEERAMAREPNPLDGADNLPNDTTLSWIAGEFAVTHDVYLGKVFEDVNNASRANPMNVLVSQNQILSTYEHPEPLEFGQVYYWRIDEVNASPDIIYKGQVWSFEIEPYVVQITNITATASSYEQNQGPGNTVDGSGLNANDGHSTIAEDMWLSNFDGPQPTWIQYEFDKAYVLLEMLVWNSNQTNERAFGLGIRSVTIDYSLDGQEWTKFDDTEFNKATGTTGYMYNTIVNLEGIYAKYIRLTVNSNWGERLEQYGLSEVRFFQIPVRASIPQPDSEAYDVALDVMLDWRAGRQAVRHEVYFSSNEQDVIDGTALLDTVSETWYQVGPLDYGKVYYWKINEVNDAANTQSWEGEVWSFTTTGFMAVDDFESYDADNPIWESWIDGLGFGSIGTPGYNPGNGTGAAVGDENTSSFTEETIVNSGSQSMPLLYNNKSGSAYYSETEHTLEQTANWAERGITELALWFRGYSGSVGSFVEGPTGTYTLTGSGSDIWAVDGVEADEFHFAYRMLNGAGSIIAKVGSIQNTNEWAKAGVMIRETLDPESAHATVVVTPEQGVSFQRRFDTAGTSTEDTTSGITAPVWVKLERTISGTFTASHSTNGTTWQTLGSPQNIQMNANVYIGLAVTAHDPDLACQAVFSNITTTGSVTGQWANQDIGITSNDPEPFYVALADTSGVIGVVAHEDPAATQINTWTKWDIDLSRFSDQGVDLTSIEKVMLGVGDRNNPVAGGMGKIYVDDIMIGNPAPPREYRNLLINGNFESSVFDPWYVYDNTGGGASAEIVSDDPIEGNSCLHVVVPTAGVNFYDVGLVQPGIVFEAGKKYTLSAFFKCKEGTLDVSFKPEHAAGTYQGYGTQTITITDQWVEYSVTTPVLSEQIEPAAITFHIGFTPGEFWVDNVRFYEGDYAAPPAESPPSADNTENKLGYGGFEDGPDTPLGTWAPLTWNLYSEGQSLEVVSDNPYEGQYCLKVTVPEATANFWDAGFKQPGHVFEEGESYTFSAWMKSLSGPLDINMKLERDGGDYSGTEQLVTISEDWAEYSITTPVYTETVDPAAATFHIGHAAGEFLIDNIKLYEGPYVPSE